FFASRRRHTRSDRDWSSDVCSSDLSFTLTIPYVRINKSGGSVRMLTGLNVLGPAGGDSIQFANSTSTLTLNGQPLTLGSTVGAEIGRASCRERAAIACCAGWSYRCT